MDFYHELHIVNIFYVQVIRDLIISIYYGIQVVLWAVNGSDFEYVISSFPLRETDFCLHLRANYIKPIVK